MNNDYIINETTDIYESLGSYDSLKFVFHLLDIICNDIENECESDEDIKNLEKLEKSLILIEEVLKENS